MLLFKGIFRKWKKESPLKLPPSRSIADAFTEYINNEIPTRFIDTSTLQLISRRDVFRIFQDQIVNVTEELVYERVGGLQSDPCASYQPQRETVLRQIIQEIIQYDILSHHCDEIAGEPTFRDISGGKRHVARFKKLTKFCKVSKKLGRKLVWVDTCCIDETNAAERSEATHSMYKWYVNAYLCVVYLAESTSCADWPREPWFTGDHTLQELLAPKRLKFYDKNWQPFTPPSIDDDRRCGEIIPSLESITGISEAVLTADNSHGIQGPTFWEVMSWASRWQTTRIEDMVYSLVGLLCVNSTVTYGEGHRAFSRLVETIAAKNPRWDIFAWFGQPSADHFALPPSPAAYPRFEPNMVDGRVGVQEFTITPNGLSLKALPLISMEISSVVDPEGPEKPFLVHLKLRPDKGNSLGEFGGLIVNCGATRLRTIRGARQLSVCIINHHGTASRKNGKLMVGKDYICFLLYSENEDEDDPIWMKLATDNLLCISYVGTPETGIRGQGTAPSDSFIFPLTTTFIRPPEA